LLFYEVPAIELSEEELLAYASRDDADEGELECQRAVNEFLVCRFRHHPIGSVLSDSIAISKELGLQLVRWAHPFGRSPRDQIRK
jgi:hypothetical protein